MKLLLLGDVVGRPGRNAVKSFLENREYDLVVANGENAAGGFGLTRNTASQLLEAGVDVITTGNHVWRHKEIADYLDEEGCPVLRPANYPPGNPGRGFTVKELNGTRLMVVNLQGRLFIPIALDCPFRVIDSIIKKNRADIVLVDFHAEATSEKQFMGRHLDGRVTVLAGTHTHVLTADARLLPKGSAYITDLGMCGSTDGVIGMAAREAGLRFLTGRFARLHVAEGKTAVNGLEVTLGEDGTVQGIELVNAEV